MQVTPNQNKSINNVPPYFGTQVNNPQNTQGQQIQPQVQQYCNQAAACSAAPQGPAGLQSHSSMLRITLIFLPRASLLNSMVHYLLKK